MNTVVLVGRVGRDAEVKYFETGKVRAIISVAVNRWDPKTNSEIADWFNVDIWDKQAEFAGEYIKRGMQVAIDGRITLDKWSDKATGEDRQTYKIIATNVKLLGSKRDVVEV